MLHLGNNYIYLWQFINIVILLLNIRYILVECDMCFIIISG